MVIPTFSRKNASLLKGLHRIATIGAGVIAAGKDKIGVSTQAELRHMGSASGLSAGIPAGRTAPKSWLC